MRSAGLAGSREGPRIAALALVVVPLLFAAPGTLVAQRPFGFRADLGVEVPKGEPDEVFQGNVRGELSVLWFPPTLASRLGAVHLGGGFSWVSFPIENDPGLKDEHWNYVGFHGLLGAAVDTAVVAVPLYAEARLIERRIRPIEHRAWDITSEDYIRYKPFTQYHCWGLEALLGVKVPLRRGARTYFDIAGRASWLLWKDELNLATHGLIDMERGWTMGMQIGLLWTP